MQIQVTAAVANFFINEARKNFHAPANLLQEQDLLIYNYCPHFTGKVQGLLIIQQDVVLYSINDVILAGFDKHLAMVPQKFACTMHDAQHRIFASLHSIP